jgi:hypothetical protein
MFDDLNPEARRVIYVIAENRPAPFRGRQSFARDDTTERSRTASCVVPEGRHIKTDESMNPDVKSRSLGWP